MCLGVVPFSFHYFSTMLGVSTLISGEGSPYLIRLLCSLGAYDVKLIRRVFVCKRVCMRCCLRVYRSFLCIDGDYIQQQLACHMSAYCLHAQAWSLLAYMVKTQILWLYKLSLGGSMFALYADYRALHAYDQVGLDLSGFLGSSTLFFSVI